MLNRLIKTILITLFITACASLPEFDKKNVDSQLTPINAIKTENKKVIWGGTIIDITNLKDATRLEILSYPLDSDDRPDKEKATQGRFLIVHPGYLESKDFVPGKDITIVGIITGTESGKIGEASYTYPILTPSQLHLWGAESESRVHFGIGIGVNIHN